MRQGPNLCGILFCILRQNAIFEAENTAFQTVSRFEKVRKNGDIPRIPQYIAVFAVKSAGDFDTIAPLAA